MYRGRHLPSARKLKLEVIPLLVKDELLVQARVNGSSNYNCSSRAVEGISGLVIPNLILDAPSNILNWKKNLAICWDVRLWFYQNTQWGLSNLEVL